MGRCRYCSTPISVRYPLIELFTASLFVLEYYIYINSHTFSLEIVPLLAFVGILFGQAVIDFETQLLPFGASLSGMAIGLIYAFLRKPWWEFFIAAAAGFIIIGAIGLIGKIIYKKDAMGGGDLVFAAFLGSFLGIQNLIIGLFFGIMLSGLFAIGLLLFTEKTRKDEFALGPFLALGGFLAQPELGLGELTKRLFGF